MFLPGPSCNERWWSFAAKYICLILFAGLPMTSMAVKRTSRWVSKPIVIDGNNNEWPQPYPYREDIDTRIQYAFANDSQTLYLTVKTSDEATKMKFRANGMTLVVDTNGERNFHTTFGFAVQDYKQDTNNNQEQRIKIRQIELKGTKCDSTYTTVKNRPGVSAAAILNDYNEVVWEIAIPFSSIYGTNAKSHIGRGWTISICFAFFGLNNDDFARMMTAPEPKNAMPVVKTDSGRAAETNSGSARGKGGHSKEASGSDGPVIDANDNTAALDRHRAGEDNLLWRIVTLAYAPEQ